MKTGNCLRCNRIVVDYHEPTEGPGQFSGTFHFDSKQENCPIFAKPPFRIGWIFDLSCRTTRCQNCYGNLAWSYDYAHEEGAWFHIKTGDISCQLKAEIE